MSDNLPQPINQQVGQQLSSSPQQLGMERNSQPKILFVILGIMLVILSAEGVLFLVIKNKRKGREVTNQKKEEISQEKITPAPIGRVVESSWEGKKTTLVKGKISNFDVNNRKINLVLEDNTSKTIDIDNKTIFMYLEVGEIQISPLQPKTIDISTFLKELKEGETINASCYDNGTAAFVTKFVDYKKSD